jgi:perosamine synthetase
MMIAELNLKAKRVIRVAEPWITDAEKAAVKYVLDSGWISSGPRVQQFEKEFAAAHDLPHGTACSSGFAALRLALAAANVKPGDHVVTSTMTMVAVAAAIIEAGAIPVFVDCDPEGDPEICDLAEACNKHSAAACILPHLYSVAYNPAGERFCCPVIEDCSECHYGKYRNYETQSVGSASDFACFSFYANKIITTGGEGGIVLSKDPDDKRRLDKLRSYAFSESEHFCHREHAFNFRMTEMQAAFGLAQHFRREEIIARRLEIAKEYTCELANTPLCLPPDYPGRAWWVYPIRSIPLGSIRSELHLAGIETRTYFKPLHQQPHLRKYAIGQTFENSDNLYRRGFYIPLYPQMSAEDVQYVTRTLRTILA